MTSARDTLRTVRLCAIGAAAVIVGACGTLVSTVDCDVNPAFCAYVQTSYPATQPGGEIPLGHVTTDGILDMPKSRVAYFNPEDTDGILIEFVEPKQK